MPDQDTIIPFSQWVEDNPSVRGAKLSSGYLQAHAHLNGGKGLKINVHADQALKEIGAVGPRLVVWNDEPTDWSAINAS